MTPQGPNAAKQVNMKINSSELKSFKKYYKAKKQLIENTRIPHSLPLF